MREVRLHDTLTDELLPLRPRRARQVSIYVCGPTVYGRVHVGNARPFVVFSLLKRFLRHEGYTVTLVSNITDVNDKIYTAAAAAGVASTALAREMTRHYIADTDRLGLGRPDEEPLASGHIALMIELIAQLIERGHAYAADGDAYFSVRSYSRYGELSHRRVDDLDQGEGGEGATRKRDPLDFALWKAQKPGEDTAWEAPWGRGRPGWHIECSAMAARLLGAGFEIHGGGSDLVFPHHENEAAQTCAALGTPLAQIWMHNGMLRLANEKMAKSLGNTQLLHAALDRYGREVLLAYFCSAHYRQPLDYDAERIAQAKAQLDRFRELGRRLHSGPSPAWSAALRERFFAALANDFNTPAALAVAFEWARLANRDLDAHDGSGASVGAADLREMLDVLGLASVLDAPAPQPPSAALELLARREAARARRDWAAADELRERLRARGWDVRDSSEGSRLLPLGT